MKHTSTNEPQLENTVIYVKQISQKKTGHAESKRLAFYKVKYYYNEF